MDEFNDRMRMRQVRVQTEGLGLWAAAHRTALDWLDANVPKGETIVEIGCGVGSFMHALRRRGYNAAGLDVAPEVVKALAHEGFRTWCGTVDTIPEGWPQTKPAAIVSFFVLHHVTDPVFFLKQIRSRWAVPLIMGFYRGPLGTRSPAEYPPRTWGWWSAQSIEKAFELSGYPEVQVLTQPRVLARLPVPKPVTRVGSPLLWRWPWLRHFVGLAVDTSLASTFRLLSPVPFLRKPFDGDLLVIAQPQQS
jgi:SAM-dependent methyltransferase